jgi:hypothetical protein
MPRGFKYVFRSTPIATGRNILAATYLIQLHGTQYQLVWHEGAATAKLQWPMSGWAQ